MAEEEGATDTVMAAAAAVVAAEVTKVEVNLRLVRNGHLLTPRAGRVWE